MRKTVISLLIAMLFAAAVNAQTEQRLSRCPSAFRTFYAKFVGSVRRAEKETVATMTKFPFVWGLDAGDEGKYTRTEFIKNFGRLFGEETADFMRERDPICTASKNGSIDVTSEDAMHLGFSRSGASYKFVSLIVEP